MITELITNTRTFRRFDQSKAIAHEDLVRIVDLARLGGSARNLQPWKYMICEQPKSCQTIFSHLGWAGYLPDWPGPGEGEQPAAYILCLLDTTISTDGDFDLGIASQNMLLGAMSKGIGGCRIASFSQSLADTLNLPAHLQLKLVIALGYPTENVTLVEAKSGASIKYWHGDNKDHFVPKRSLDDILLPHSLTK